jgi:hypothetical protein
MNGQKTAPTSINQTLTSEPLTVGARTLQFVVRLAGWQLVGGPGFHGTLVRLTPQAVIIEEEGRQRTVPMTDPARDDLRRIAGVALLVSGLCWIVLVVVRLRLNRK